MTLPSTEVQKDDDLLGLLSFRGLMYFLPKPRFSLCHYFQLNSVGNSAKCAVDGAAASQSRVGQEGMPNLPIDTRIILIIVTTSRKQQVIVTSHPG